MACRSEPHGSPSRRGFLTGLGVVLAAPFIVRTPGLLMPIKPLLSGSDVYSQIGLHGVDFILDTDGGLDYRFLLPHIKVTGYLQNLYMPWALTAGEPDGVC
jgi:hypothetical protein